MKTILTISFIFVFIHMIRCFKTFSELGDLIRCYEKKGNLQLSDEIVNGQTLPLPNSIETFISLVERLEASYPNLQPQEVTRRLLVTFRADNIPADLRFENPVWESNNEVERAFFSIDYLTNMWRKEDLTEDEECALHFMLSHTFNDTLQGSENEESIGSDQKFSKHPREYGVVSILGKKKQAFSLGKVLLGIYAGLLGNNKDIDASELRKKYRGVSSLDDRLNGVKLNRLSAVTIADLVTLYIKDPNHKKREVSFMPNGDWVDAACTVEYLLEDNNKGFISMSHLRGAIDGLIIGKKIEENQNYFRQLRLSEILRMYYGPTGLLSETMSSKADMKSDFQWCKRSERFREFTTLGEEILNYLKFYINLPKNSPTDDIVSEINDILSNIQGSTEIFNENADEPNLCSPVSEREKCNTPSDVFAILDWQTNEDLKKLQIQVLGILSNDLDIRPKGSSLGAYTNLSPVQNKGLHIMSNNTGLAGCAPCYAKYFKRIGSSRQGEAEVLNYLNQTLTEFEENRIKDEIATPAKVVLLFNFGSPVNDDRLRNAIWEITRVFREVTILPIGPKKEHLQVFSQNDDTDIFTDTSATVLASKLKSRICKVPAEFQFKECYRSNQGTEADNKQTAFIPINKKQYYAMYPKYFLKSFNIKMKFKAVDGAHIKVCFSRNYFRIIEEGTQYKECRDAGEEVEFWTSNPCYKKNEHNCEPFYFSIEGVKPGSGLCQSIDCRTPKDIAFEFSHEGISCNAGSFITSSSMLFLAVIIFQILMKN